MKDKQIIETLLRAFKDNRVDLDYSVDYIFNGYRNSTQFNQRSFNIGMYVGGIIMFIVTYLFS